jgi:ABC-2 type transport system ATP-binding protein
VKEAKESKDGYRLSVENSGKNLQSLLCVAGSVDFVEVHSPDLNDVFLHYTGRAMREEEGDLGDYVRDMNKARGNQ